MKDLFAANSACALLPPFLITLSYTELDVSPPLIKPFVVAAAAIATPLPLISPAVTLLPNILKASLAAAKPGPKSCITSSAPNVRAPTGYLAVSFATSIPAFILDLKPADILLKSPFILFTPSTQPTCSALMSAAVWVSA